MRVEHTVAPCDPMLGSGFDLDVECHMMRFEPLDPHLSDLIADVEPLGEELMRPVVWNVTNWPFWVSITNRNFYVIDLI